MKEILITRERRSEMFKQLLALQTQFFRARKWTWREGWCAGEECDEWIDESGSIMWASVQDYIFSPANIMMFMERHEISIEHNGKESYTAITNTGIVGHGICHRSAVLTAMINHYRKENGIN